MQVKKYCVINLMTSLNDNKLVLGIAVLMLNIGARHIPNDLGSNYQKVLENDLVKRFVLFSLFFVTTRDLVIALCLSLLASFIVFGFLNDNSKFTLVRGNDEIQNKMNMYFPVQ